MKEVSKEVFYNFINPLDVCVSVESTYVCFFKFRNGKIVGKSNWDKKTLEYKYFLNN